MEATAAKTAGQFVVSPCCKPIPPQPSLRWDKTARQAEWQHFLLPFLRGEALRALRSRAEGFLEN